MIKRPFEEWMFDSMSYRGEQSIKMISGYKPIQRMAITKEKHNSVHEMEWILLQVMARFKSTRAWLISRGQPPRRCSSPSPLPSGGTGALDPSAQASRLPVYWHLQHHELHSTRLHSYNINRLHIAAKVLGVCGLSPVSPRLHDDCSPCVQPLVSK